MDRISLDISLSSFFVRIFLLQRIFLPATRLLLSSSTTRNKKKRKDKGGRRKSSRYWKRDIDSDDDVSVINFLISRRDRR